MPISQSPVTAENAATAAAEAAAEKKAHDIIALDVTGIMDVTDRLLICSGSSDRQVRAISNEIRKRMREEGVDVMHQEGSPEGGWILIDYGDVIVHVFTEEVRGFYDLERLWKDAPKTSFEPVAS